ncbi:MAG: VRR-NUC domain-containing protein [Pseudomonadota bacterium]|nr:VRR-NUC domain-containing protein [Pseudomonadota bacterium]
MSRRRRSFTKAFGNPDTQKAIGTVIPRSKPVLVASEESEQQVVMQWAALAFKVDGEPLSEYLHHSPNGGKREAKINDQTGKRYCPEGQQLKALGTKGGWPDLKLALARGGYFGLYIEMKSLNGRTSPDQRKIIKRLSEQGYLAVVCHGATEAIDTLKKYMAWPITVTKKMEWN